MSGETDDNAAGGVSANEASTSKTPEAAARSSPASAGPPPIEFLPTAIDLGVVAPNKTVSGTVQVRNTGTEPLNVVATRASCGCTTAQFEHTILQPGESAPLIAAYRSSSTMGPKQEAVRILFEGFSLIEVPVLVTVAMAVRAEPTYVSLLEDDTGNRQLSGEYVVSSSDGNPFRIIAVNGDPPVFAESDSGGVTDEPRSTYRLRYDFSGFDPVSCVDSNGRRMPGWIVLETDHPECAVFDMEVRHECVKRSPILPTDQWVIPEKRVLITELSPGQPVEVEVEAKWFPRRARTDPILRVGSETGQFKAVLLSVEQQQGAYLCRVRITPSPQHRGLIYGTMRFHSNHQSAAVTVIGSVK